MGLQDLPQDRRWRASSSLCRHPIHIHGLTFELFARDGYPLPAPFKCAWAFYCHILGHAEGQTGMFGLVTALIVSA